MKGRTRLIVPGLFKSKYMTYMIDVKATGNTIERRYTDFANLRQELVKTYPGYLIPPIPKKKAGKTTEAAFLQKRQDLLQEFLNEITRHPVLGSSKLVTQFLTLPDKEWENVIKTFAKLPGFKAINDFRTMEGSANIEITEYNEKYCERIQPLIEVAKDKLKTIKDYNKNIISEFDKLGELFIASTQAYKDIAITFSSLGDNTLTVMYERMSESHKHLGNIYRGFKNVLMSELVNYYRFHKYEMAALSELVLAQKNAGVMMNMLEKRLWNKKESKFSQKNIATWDINPNMKATPEALINDKTLAFQEMLHKETAEVRNSRIFYGYYTNKVIEEFSRISKKNWKKAKDHFMVLPSLFIDKEEELKQVWIGFLEKMKAFTPEDRLRELEDPPTKVK